MLERVMPSPGLLFGSVLYRSDLHQHQDLVNCFQEDFGPAIVSFPQFNPLFDYYAKEMGKKDCLRRFFVLSALPLKRETLLSAKLWAQNFELKHSIDEKRTVNFDIGFLTPENFVLATSKNYSHRTYLGEGIFTDLTYYFHEGRFQTLPWTYPDYVDSDKLEFFSWARSYLLSSLTLKDDLFN